MRSAFPRVVLSAAAVLAITGCYDFDAALETCAKVGRCTSSDQQTNPSDGSDGGGDGADGGVAGPDAGWVAPCSDGGYVLEGRVCKNGWCWDLPRPMGNDLTAVSGSSGFVVAGGKGGTILQIDGCNVSQVEYADRNDVRDVYVRAPHDFWVVGDGDLAQHWLPDGSTETHDFGATTDVTAVSGDHGGLMFTSVSGGVGAAKLLTHSESGSSWEDFQVPADVPLAAAGVANDWWLVSASGLAHASSTAAPWSTVQLSSAATPYGSAWRSPSGRLWLVGNGSTVFRNTGPGSENFETAASNLLIGNFPISLHAVGGRSDASVLVAGASGGMFELRNDSWRRAGLDAQSHPVTTQDYLDLWANPGGPAWAVGGGGTLAVGEDTTWSDLRARFGYQTATNLNAVVYDNGTWIAVGDNGLVLQRDSVGQWSPMAAQPSGAGNLLAVTTVGPGHYFAAGAGALYEYLNGTWTTDTITFASGGTPPSDWTIRAMASMSSTTAWAVGNQGTRGLVLLYSGGQWKELGSSEPVLHDVATVSETEAWAVGAGGRLAQLTSSGSAQDFTFKDGSGTAWTLRSVLPTVSGNVYVGGVGVIGMLDRNSRQFVNLPDPGLQSHTLLDAVPTAAGLLFVGSAGDAWLVDTGNTLTHQPTGAQRDLRGAVVDPNGRVLVVGDSGSALTFVP